MARLTFELVEKYALECNYNLVKKNGKYLISTMLENLEVQACLLCKNLQEVLEVIKLGTLLRCYSCKITSNNADIRQEQEDALMSENAAEEEAQINDTLDETFINDNQNMKTLYIVRGCPGDGKTSLANLIGLKIVAADDYPGLYVDGKYQQHLQKESHQWCISQAESFMQQGILSVAVHNTFTRIFYIKPYIELANKYGYSIHIIHSEAVLVNGGRTVDTHNVPLDVLASMRNGWEPFNAVPKLGMTAKDIAQQIEKAKAYPDAIIFDMGGTIKRTKSGETFPVSPDDFEITPEFDEFAKLIKNKREIDYFIVSNQRGVSGGQKTAEFLEKESAWVSSDIHTLYKMYFFDMYFLVKDYALTTDRRDGWGEIANIFPKPSPSVFGLMNRQRYKNWWIVGDAHTDERSEDWQFAQNIQKAHPELNIAYIPIELAAYIYQLHHT